MGEYEPNDSRNVTGAGNKLGQNEGNPNTNQGGQHWQQSASSTQPGAPIAADHQQGHGQDPGMRSQAVGQDRGQQQASQSSGGQQQQFQQGGGQMGGASVSSSGSGGATGNQAGGQTGGGSGYQASAAGGLGQQGGQQAGGASRFAGQIREHMEVIGADGVHLGTVDHVDGDRIKLTRRDSGAGYEGGQHTGHHHYLPLGLVAEIEGDRVRLSANADVAYGMEEEEGGQDT